MDTVEWGTQEPVTRRPGRVRSVVAATGGRRAGAALALVGVAVLIAAELLPWATLHLTAGAGGTGTGFGLPGTTLYGLNYGRGSSVSLLAPDSDVPRLFTVGLGRLGSDGTLVYRLGTVLLLAMVGAALLARPAQRRTAFGVGLGVLAGQLVVVSGMVHSAGAVTPTGANGQPFQTAPIVTSTDFQAGSFCAFIALGVLLAALLASVLPDQVRSRLVTGAGAPAEVQFDEEPRELTVAPAAPLDGAYSGRSDQYLR